jgi:GNAT superfamily N-acetyltransferase
MRVRRAVPGDEAIVRSLRIQALTDAPDDFASTLEREQARTHADWQRWISSGATFLLEVPDGPRGIAAGIPHRTDSSAVFLVSVWVHPSWRGTGASDALVGAFLDWARSERVETAWLHVDKRNARARRLYERNGFRVTGVEILRERDGMPELEMRRAVGKAAPG